MKTLVGYYNLSLWLDSMSLIYIFINVLTMLRYFRWVDFFLGSVTESLRIAICFIVIFFVMVFGMAVCSMTLYGN